MATTVSSVTNGPFTLLPRANRGAALFTERSLQPIPLLLPWPCAWLWNTVLPPHLLTSHGTTFVQHSRVYRIPSLPSRAKSSFDVIRRKDMDRLRLRFDRVRSSCAKWKLWGNEKSENRIVDRFNPMDIRRDWKKEQGTSQNFFTGLFLSTRNSCQQRCGATTLRMGEKTPVK